VRYRTSSCGSIKAWLGAVSFVQRFGSALNAHVHLLRDRRGVRRRRGWQVHFAEASALTPEELAAAQQQVRARRLRWFAPSPGVHPLVIALPMTAFQP
jgi:hypothetical protein